MTGVIEEYNPAGDKPDEIVTVPSYFVIDNGNDTYSSHKVIGIDPGLFKDNKDIKAVQLSRFISEIPASAFEGCSSLEYVLAPYSVSIGDKAFSGCVSLNEYGLPENIERIGTDAFKDAPAIDATAGSYATAKGAAASGAKNIVLDIAKIPEDEAENMQLEVSSADTFDLRGLTDKNETGEYKGLTVKSEAGTTIINGIAFTESPGIPMDITSENVTLNKVTADCKGFALALKADNTDLKLDRTVNLLSEGENAVICKNLTLSPLNVDIVGKLQLDGNLLCCGELSGDRYLDFTSGEIINISEEEFDRYLSSERIYFDANGGSVEPEYMDFAKNAALGDLPLPTRDYYSFDGWYTEREGGEKVTESTVLDSTFEADTLYAHWIENGVSSWVPADEAPEGSEITGRKYVYKQTSYTSSSSPSLSGWTRYDYEWEWGPYGSWSDWIIYYDGKDASDSKQTETRTAYRYYYFMCSNCYDHHPYYGITCDTCGASGTVLESSYIERWEPEYPYNRPYGTWGSTTKQWTYFGDANYWNLYFWDSSNVVSAVQGRYRTRSKEYTYYFEKTVTKESETYPTGSNISDIQEYVQYKIK